MSGKPLSTQTLRRLPIYLGYLREWESPSVSATMIAAALNLKEVQVRKDLAAVSDGGRPGVGYDTLGLIEDLTRYLGYDCETKAVLVGAGNLGRALISYEELGARGLRIVAAFDQSPRVTGQMIAGRVVYPMSALAGICRAERVRLGILTVPDHEAQAACDRMIASGVKAVWNFAPTHLNVPRGVVLQNENLVSSLTVLSRRLLEQIAQAEPRAED